MASLFGVVPIPVLTQAQAQALVIGVAAAGAWMYGRPVVDIVTNLGNQALNTVVR